jgi:hypothetical protein
VAALEDQFQATHDRVPDSIVFGHEALDPSKLTPFVRKALRRASGVGRSLRCTLP